MFDVIRITPDSAELYRRVRLDALRTDPMAFGSTYERELQLTSDDWVRRAALLDGTIHIGLFAMIDGEACGLAACFRDEEDAALGHIISMWVAPVCRRAGLGLTLLEAIRSWAELQGIAMLQLMVTSGNHGAISLYHRAGFKETGRSERYPNDPTLIELEMLRSTEQKIL